MKFVALVSGGKDSIYSIHKLVAQGHQLLCLANLTTPKKFLELDSYMYQSVATESTLLIAQCLEKPIIQRTINRKAVNIELDYQPTEDDEVEDLFLLLKEVKEKFPEVEAVSSGAIHSTYQKNRVENVCGRLGLKSLAPLWKRE